MEEVLVVLCGEIDQALRSYQLMLLLLMLMLSAE